MAIASNYEHFSEITPKKGRTKYCTRLTRLGKRKNFFIKFHPLRSTSVICAELSRTILTFYLRNITQLDFTCLTSRHKYRNREFLRQIIFSIIPVNKRLIDLNHRVKSKFKKIKRFSKANKNGTIRRINSLVECNTQIRGYWNKNILLTHPQPLMNHAHTVTRDK